MKYCGLVTDKSWNECLMKCSPTLKSEIIQRENKRHNWKILAGFDYIYALNRLPRVFLDELS